MTEEQYREKLIEGIDRTTTIAEGLEKCKAFEMACEDVKNNIGKINDSWHLVPEDDKWKDRMRELRTSKLASSYLVNMITMYRNECKKMQTELNKLDNKEKEINKDYDNA